MQKQGFQVKCFFAIIIMILTKEEGEEEDEEEEEAEERRKMILFSGSSFFEKSINRKNKPELYIQIESQPFSLSFCSLLRLLLRSHHS